MRVPRSALALSIFVALPIVFALTYHRRYY